MRGSSLQSYPVAHGGKPKGLLRAVRWSGSSDPALLREAGAGASHPYVSQDARCENLPGPAPVKVRSLQANAIAYTVTDVLVEWDGDAGYHLSWEASWLVRRVQQERAWEPLPEGP